MNLIITLLVKEFPVLRHLNPVHSSCHTSFRTHFNITFPSLIRSPIWFLHFIYSPNKTAPCLCCRIEAVDLQSFLLSINCLHFVWYDVSLPQNICWHSQVQCVMNGMQSQESLWLFCNMLLLLDSNNRPIRMEGERRHVSV